MDRWLAYLGVMRNNSMRGVFGVALVLVAVIGVTAVGSPGSAASVTPAWRIVPGPSLNEGALASVSCLGPKTCFAVGDRDSANPLVERWSGGRWSYMAFPQLSGGSQGHLYSVSCTSLSWCVAVGERNSSGGPVSQYTLAAQWNGSAWSVAPTPVLSDNSVLSGVSCTSSTNCFAVGLSGEAALIEHWDGTAWSVVSSPGSVVPGEAMALRSVTCRSATRCVAVGTRYSATGSKTLIERWNGMAWSVIASPNRSTAKYQSLSGVSCSAVTNCFAVGTSTGLSFGKTLIEHWDGAAWSIVANPNLSGKTVGLSAVSCDSATRCVAVGSVGLASTIPTTTLAQHWDGTAWSIVATPNPAGQSENQLKGVSCIALSSCIAVGVSANIPDRGIHEAYQ